MKTRTLGSLFLLPLLAAALVTAASAEEVQYPLSDSPNDGYLIFDTETGEITGTGNGSAIIELDVPAEINGTAVTGIGRSAFTNCTNLTRLTLPESMTSIGTYAFEGCIALAEAVIPYTVEDFGDGSNAFRSCPETLTLKGHERSHAQVLAAEKGFGWETTLGVSPVTETAVETTEELLQALGNHARIILADGLYPIDAPLDLTGLVDVTLMAASTGGAEVLSSDTMDPVVMAKDTYSLLTGCLDLEGMILGHESVSTSKTSNCTDTNRNSDADVISCRETHYLTVDRCDLWGCGLRALDLNSCLHVTVSDSILRDCVYCAYSAFACDAVIRNCIISGNNYQNDQTYPCVDSYSMVRGIDTGNRFAFEGCKFLNNWSKRLNYNENSAVDEHYVNCIFHDNAWQEGAAPKPYGVCLGGTTWQVKDGELILGEDIPLDDGTVLESSGAEVPNYSEFSKPWKRAFSQGRGDSPVGTMRDESGQTLYYELADGAVTVSDAGAAYGNSHIRDYAPVIVACYDENGRMLSVRILTEPGSVEVQGDTAKLMWLRKESNEGEVDDESWTSWLAPQCQSVLLDLNPAEIP